MPDSCVRTSVRIGGGEGGRQPGVGGDEGGVGGSGGVVEPSTEVGP